MAGNKLGPKAYYLYTDDAGASYSILQDVDLAFAAGNQADDSNPPMPGRFKPRVAHVEDATGARKAIVCGSADSPLYGQNVSVAVTIDEDSWYTTGRRGERLSVASNGIVGPTPEP